MEAEVRSYITWYLGPPKTDRIYIGIVLDDENKGWSIIADAGPETPVGVFRVSWLVSFQAPPLVPGVTYDVYLGGKLVATVEVILQDEDAGEARRLLTGDYHADPKDGRPKWREHTIQWVHQALGLDLETATRLVGIETRLMWALE